MRVLHGTSSLAGSGRMETNLYVFPNFSFQCSYLTVRGLLALQGGVIEHFAPLLKLTSSHSFSQHILIPAAEHSSSSDRPLEAIKLYNLAGSYDTVVSSLASSLGASLSQPNAGGERGKQVESTAREIVRHYVRMNRGTGAGGSREAVEKLLRIREAIGLREEGRVDAALEVRAACSYSFEVYRNADCGILIAPRKHGSYLARR